MSNERDRSTIPDPYGSVAAFTYDACGRLTSVEDRAGCTRWLAGTTDGPVPPRAAGSVGTPCTAASCLRHCFEFRLCGSERQEQTLALADFGSAVLIAAIERVR